MQGNKRVMLGRQVFWVIRMWFGTKKACKGMYTFLDQAKLRLRGDNDTQRFYDQWIDFTSGLEPD
eukprot:3697498-Alexandrium_andersonii.AAC.1